MELDDILELAIKSGASDIHLTVGKQPCLRVNGEMEEVECGLLKPEDTVKYCKQLLGEAFDKYTKEKDVDLSYTIPGRGRFRVNTFTQRGSCALVLRVITSTIPTFEALNMPQVIRDVATLKRGLVLVTGPTGSGKSTTLAAIIDEINSTRKGHIITLEDPVEFMHNHKKSIVNQRDIGIGKDCDTYARGLKSALREDPDVILVGEMRDYETISTAITAAETGHLVFSTLHTIGAAKTIDRIIDVFEPAQQSQVKSQLSSVVQAIVSQQLLPKVSGKGRVAALEIMVANPAIQNLVREGKTSQIQSVIDTSGKLGMRSMDGALVELVKRGQVTREVALECAVDKSTFMRMIGM